MKCAQCSFAYDRNYGILIIKPIQFRSVVLLTGTYLPIKF